MNYILSYDIEQVYTSKGYDVKMDCSKSSDYLVITNPKDKYGFKFVVRISDHDAMTGRSACADMQLITSEMNRGTWNGEFESRYGFDGDDADDCGEYYYATEQERDEAVKAVIFAKMKGKIDF